MVQVLLGANEVDLHRQLISASEDARKLQERLLTSGERWLPVVGFERWYDVSDFGRIYSVRAARTLLSPPNGRGYPVVNLCGNGTRACFAVHQVVAATFLGPCPNGLEVDHVDGDRLNPRLSNLEYVTHAENGRRGWARAHAYRAAARAGATAAIALLLALAAPACNASAAHWPTPEDKCRTLCAPRDVRELTWAGGCVCEPAMASAGPRDGGGR